MSSGVQLSGNEMLNKKVLSSRRNVRNDETVRVTTKYIADTLLLCVSELLVFRVNHSKVAILSKTVWAYSILAVYEYSNSGLGQA